MPAAHRIKISEKEARNGFGEKWYHPYKEKFICFSKATYELFSIIFKTSVTVFLS